jgi:hypothetical protein
MPNDILQVGALQGGRIKARERAKLVAELEEAAIKANTDAGYQSATVTAQQRAEINKLADAIEAATRRRRESHEALLKFSVEGRDFAKNFDQFAISSFGNFESALTGIVTGAKSAKEAFHDMATAILSDLARMIIRMQVTAPLAASLAGLFTPAAAGVAGKTGAVPTFAGGGVMDHDGLAVLHANETVFTPKQLQALTTGLRSTGGSNSNYAPVYNIDARGSQMTEGQFRTILNEHGRNLMQTIERRAPANMANNRLLYA